MCVKPTAVVVMKEHLRIRTVSVFPSSNIAFSFSCSIFLGLMVKRACSYSSSPKQNSLHPRYDGLRPSRAQGSFLVFFLCLKEVPLKAASFRLVHNVSCPLLRGGLKKFLPGVEITPGESLSCTYAVNLPIVSLVPEGSLFLAFEAFAFRMSHII